MRRPDWQVDRTFLAGDDGGPGGQDAVAVGAALALVWPGTLTVATVHRPPLIGSRNRLSRAGRQAARIAEAGARRAATDATPTHIAAHTVGEGLHALAGSTARAVVLGRPRSQRHPPRPETLRAAGSRTALAIAARDVAIDLRFRRVVLVIESERDSHSRRLVRRGVERQLWALLEFAGELALRAGLQVRLAAVCSEDEDQALVLDTMIEFAAELPQNLRPRAQVATTRTEQNDLGCEVHLAPSLSACGALTTDLTHDELLVRVRQRRFAGNDSRCADQFDAPELLDDDGPSVLVLPPAPAQPR